MQRIMIPIIFKAFLIFAISPLFLDKLTNNVLYFNGTKVPFAKYYIIIPLAKQASIRETVRISKKVPFLSG